MQNGTFAPPTLTLHPRNVHINFPELCHWSGVLLGGGADTPPGNQMHPSYSLLRPLANVCGVLLAPAWIYTCILSKVFCMSPDLPLTPGGGWRMYKSSWKSSNLWSPDVSVVALQPPQSTEKAVEEEQSVSGIDPFTSCNIVTGGMSGCRGGISPTGAFP